MVMDITHYDPCLPYYSMYFVTNRIELDLHWNWVSRIQIWWISIPYFVVLPFRLAFKKWNITEVMIIMVETVLWRDWKFRHRSYSYRIQLFLALYDGQGVRRKLTRMFLIDLKNQTSFWVEKLRMVNKPFYEEILNDYYFDRNCFSLVEMHFVIWWQ